jgi:tRNA(Ile)-lysidine synthase TilS/MesJ
MLHVLGKLPRELVVAVSGGPDSMAILDFLNNNHKVTAYYFDHGTTFGEEAYHFLKENYICNKRFVLIST